MSLFAEVAGLKAAVEALKAASTGAPVDLSPIVETINELGARVDTLEADVGKPTDEAAA